METGVRGEARLRVQRRMLEEQGHDIKISLTVPCQCYPYPCYIPTDRVTQIQC